MRSLKRIVIVALVGIVPAACTYNPATGRNQFLLLSTEQEIRLGNESKTALVEEYGGETEAPELRAYVERIGHSMASRTEADYPQLPWEFTVLDSDVINAFALPGGKVFISRGLLSRFDNEAQVAGVLGHEIGHVTAQHIDERISQAMIISGITLATAAATSDSDSDLARAVPLIVGVGGQGYLLTFSRNQESEADKQGVKYMAAAGYDPQGMMEVLEVLAQAASGSRPPEFLSTHPYPESRMETVAQLLAGPYHYTQDNPDFGKFPQRFEREAAPYLPAPPEHVTMAPTAQARTLSN